MKSFKVKSSKLFLILNGQILSFFRPWHLEFDFEQKNLISRRRNWHLISYDEESYLFKSVRNVKINTHLFGANVSIKVYAGEVEVFYIKKRDANKIKTILLNNNWAKNDMDIIIDLS